MKNLLSTLTIAITMWFTCSTATALDLSQSDKQYHLAVGTGIGYLCGELAEEVQRPHWIGQLSSGILCSMVAGIAKEVVIDGFIRESGADQQDVWATMIGGAVGAAISIPLEF